MKIEIKDSKLRKMVEKKPELVDLAMEVTDYFTYSDGVCTNRYEAVEDFYGYIRNDLGIRISIDDFNDIVEAVIKAQ